jgi:preprotein translocase subunit YajC
MSSANLSILAQAAAPAGGPPAWTSFLPLVFMFLIFWFLILRPQMRQQKALRDKIGAVKKGDQVITGGGFVGKVVKADENYLEIELGQNMKVKALRSSILDVVAPPGAAND